MQPPGGKPGLTSTVYHKDRGMTIIFLDKILNFYKICYKKINSQFRIHHSVFQMVKQRFLFVRDEPVHDGFKERLQGVADHFAFQAQSGQVAPVYSQIL